MSQPLRHVLATLLLATMAGAFSATAHAQEVPPPKVSKVQAGYYHLQLGDVEVTALSDGTLPFPTKTLLTNAKPGEIDRRLNESFQTQSVQANINAFLIKTDGRLILVDAGTGELYGPALNKLEGSLRAAGESADRITDILVTHIHTDHTGGLMDGARMVFPNATLHVDKKEVDYWLSPANRAQASAANKKYFDEALAKVKPYLDAGRVQAFNGATQLFPGIRSIPSPGHTPGHSFYELQSKGEKLVFWGDIVHMAAVQMPDPDVTIVFDVHPAAAAATRKKAFADAAQGRYLVAGDHISFPGIGHLRREGDGYGWVPITYINDYYNTADGK